MPHQTSTIYISTTFHHLILSLISPLSPSTTAKKGNDESLLPSGIWFNSFSILGLGSTELYKNPIYWESKLLPTLPTQDPMIACIKPTFPSLRFVLSPARIGELSGVRSSFELPPFRSSRFALFPPKEY